MIDKRNNYANFLCIIKVPNVSPGSTWIFEDFMNIFEQSKDFKGHSEDPPNIFRCKS